MNLGFDAASAVVSTPASPHRAAKIPLRMDRIVAGNCSGARRLPRLCILAWRDHRMGSSGSNRLLAFAAVIRPICENVADVPIEGDLVQNFGQHGSITDVAAGDCPNFQRFPVDTMCTLRHVRCLEPPCLHVFHSPSPSALIPVLSIKRFNGQAPPRYGRLTFSVSCGGKEC